jgi:hypothetical protein
MSAGQPGRSSYRQHSVASRPEIWWIRPSGLLAFITLPVFLLSSALGAPIMATFRSVNFIDGMTVLYGSLAIVSCILGSKLGEAYARGRPSSYQWDAERVEMAIIFLSAVSVASHLILLGSMLMRIDLVLAALSGTQGAIYQLKAQMNKMTGLTSFTQVYLLAMPLLGVYRVFFGRAVSFRTKAVITILIMLVIARAYLALERFAVIEFAAGYYIPVLLLSKKRPRLINLYPLMGFVGLYIMFASGEYIRTWAYYKDSYGSFWEYANLRLLGYIATATNNAAGAYELTGAVGYPYFTASLIRKFPLWESLGVTFADSPIHAFFEQYGNEEFNNPSGTLSGLLDYGPLFPPYYLIVGFIGGALYRSLIKRQPIGVLFFPAWYLGFLMMTQII